MKPLSGGLSGHLASGTTQLAWCWRIERSDGVVFGFTDHDRTLTFDGVDYEPESGFLAAEIRAGSELSVDAQDAEGVLSSDRITETDILDGRWDNAEVLVYRVHWKAAGQLVLGMDFVGGGYFADPVAEFDRALLRRGNIGQVRRGRTIFVTEVRSMAHVLNQTVGRVYQGSCDAALGDGRCKINLESSSYRGTGAVSSLAGGRSFIASGLGLYDPGLFSLGTIEWTSGANDGRFAEVSAHSVSGGSVIIALLEEPVRAVEAGDTFRIRAGCDKTIATCHGKFSNVANFRGFPTIPGPDTVMRVATKDGGHTGGVL